jgi:hypothetical protein
MRMHFSSVARVGWVGFLHVCKTLPVACMPYRAFDDEVDVYVHVLQISSLDSSATELRHRCVRAGLLLKVKLCVGRRGKRASSIACLATSGADAVSCRRIKSDDGNCTPHTRKLFTTCFSGGDQKMRGKQVFSNFCLYTVEWCCVRHRTTHPCSNSTSPPHIARAKPRCFSGPLSPLASGPLSLTSNAQPPKLSQS